MPQGSVAEGVLEELVREEIGRFVAGSAENRFPDGDAPYFDAPLVGFAAASDPLFSEYKSIVGSFHALPAEVLPGARTVIVWVLPVIAATRRSNAAQQLWPSREWALTRTNGEIFNSALRSHLVAFLEGRGARAIAPQLAPGWRQLEDPRLGLASTWSERHAAYAAGLGTFSLNDGFITERGIAHRLGSVVTDLLLAPTLRTAPDHRHHCLRFRSGTCGACIARCPAGALGDGGHSKDLCRAYVYEAAPDAVGAGYGVPQTGCGLCQTKVPCEGRVPK